MFSIRFSRPIYSCPVEEWWFEIGRLVLAQCLINAHVIVFVVVVVFARRQVLDPARARHDARAHERGRRGRPSAFLAVRFDGRVRLCSFSFRDHDACVVSRSDDDCSVGRVIHHGRRITRESHTHGLGWCSWGVGWCSRVGVSRRTYAPSSPSSAPRTSSPSRRSTAVSDARCCFVDAPARRRANKCRSSRWAAGDQMYYACAVTFLPRRPELAR